MATHGRLAFGIVIKKQLLKTSYKFPLDAPRAQAHAQMFGNKLPGAHKHLAREKAEWLAGLLAGGLLVG